MSITAYCKVFCNLNTAAFYLKTVSFFYEAQKIATFIYTCISNLVLFIITSAVCFLTISAYSSSVKPLHRSRDQIHLQKFGEMGQEETQSRLEPG